MRSGQTLTQNNTKKSLGVTLRKDFKKNHNLYIMVLPVIIYYILFMYKPMYGVLMAFQDFEPRKGITGSEWVGFANFIAFFKTDSFGRILKNTLVISISSIVFCFPAGIIFALLLNEIKCKLAKSIVQTVSYLPHFISLVVICGMIKAFTMDTGVINYIIGIFDGEKTTMLNHPTMFLPIYLISDIWQNVGWNSIIFVAAMAGIDQALYEAAELDGANRWKKVIHVTVPSIMPTIITLLILRVGNTLNVGFEKIILLYNPAIYSTSDVISTYVYRRGLVDLKWSFSAAVGLFNSVINFILIIAANQISRKVSETSLW